MYMYIKMLKLISILKPHFVLDFCYIFIDDALDTFS